MFIAQHRFLHRTKIFHCRGEFFIFSFFSLQQQGCYARHGKSNGLLSVIKSLLSFQIRVNSDKNL